MGNPHINVPSHNPKPQDQPLPTVWNSCYCCGGKHHHTRCQFKDATCHYCHKKGHLIRVCRKRQNKENKSFSNKPTWLKIVTLIWVVERINLPHRHVFASALQGLLHRFNCHLTNTLVKLSGKKPGSCCTPANFPISARTLRLNLWTENCFYVAIHTYI